MNLVFQGKPRRVVYQANSLCLAEYIFELLPLRKTCTARPVDLSSQETDRRFIDGMPNIFPRVEPEDNWLDADRVRAILVGEP